MNPRFEALKSLSQKKMVSLKGNREETLKPIFFSSVISKFLSKELIDRWQCYQNYQALLYEKEIASIQEGVKKWALLEGATHFAYPFYPIGSFESKELCFEKCMDELDLSKQVLDQFALYENRDFSGYLKWDLMLFPYLIRKGKKVTLVIPSLVFEKGGLCLDRKKALYASEEMLTSALSRFAKIFDAEKPSLHLSTTLNYFALYRPLCDHRKDLIFLKESVIQSTFPPKQLKVPGEFLEQVDLLLSATQSSLMGGKSPFCHFIKTSCDLPPFCAIEQHQMLLGFIKEIAEEQNLSFFYQNAPFEKDQPLFTSLQLQISSPSFIGCTKDSKIYRTLYASFLKAVHDYQELLTFSQVQNPKFLLKEEKVVISYQSTVDPIWVESVMQSVLAHTLELTLDEKGEHIEEKPPFKKGEKIKPSILIERKSLECFREVLNERELELYYESFVEKDVLFYSKKSLVLEEIFTQDLFSYINWDEKEELKEKIDLLIEEINRFKKQMKDMGKEAMLKVFERLIQPKIEELSSILSALEKSTPDRAWPLPKMDELINWMELA